jgi:hypothetical protein
MSFASVPYACILYATKIKGLKCSMSETGSDINVQETSYIQSFVIYFYLSTYDFSLHSINYDYLCHVSKKQRHQYVYQFK